MLRHAGLFAVLAFVAVAGCSDDDDGQSAGTSPAPTPAPSETEPTARDRPELARSQGGPRVETIAENLESPWELAFLPDGRAIVTERPGRVRLLNADLTLREEPLADMPLVAEIGEGGLLGAAVDPRFAANGFVYFYRTTPAENEVVRYRLDGDRLTDETEIANGIAREAFHDGGRLRFGPDRFLYFSSGDAGKGPSAQNPRSLNGKILRLAPRQYRGHGGRPEVFSLGHRNPQGFDWRPGSGRMVATEHGPQARTR